MDHELALVLIAPFLQGLPDLVRLMKCSRMCYREVPLSITVVDLSTRYAYATRNGSASTIAAPGWHLSAEAIAAFTRKFSNISHLDVSRIQNLECATALSGLVNLQTLIALGTRIEDLNGIEKCSKLRDLNVSFTRIFNLKPLRASNSLEVLNLEFTDITSISSLVACAPVLKYLNLSRSQCADIEVLENAPNLEYLALSGTHVKDIGPLQSCQKIKALLLDSSRVCDLKPLTNNLELLELNIGRTFVNDIQPLGSCLSLKVLRVGHTRINTFAPLVTCKKLETLDLGKFGGRSVEVSPPRREQSNL